MGKADDIIKILGSNLRKLFRMNDIKYEKLQEIRIRINTPFLIIYHGKEIFLSEKGMTEFANNDTYIISREDIRETLEYVSNYSLYAFEDEIRQGFITVQGGHRIGLAGKVVVGDGFVKTMQCITFINIRVAHEIIGCGNCVIPYLYDGHTLNHTLFISPPGCGKTTLLRDVIRLVSDGNGIYPGMNVGVVDERSEIAACYKGIPQNYVGVRTDILDACPKGAGMLMLIRSMSPKVIAVDEIGHHADVDAIAYVMNCGCIILATVHGCSVDDISKKPVLRQLLDYKIFKRFVVLSGQQGPGVVKHIWDQQGTLLYKGMEDK